MHINILSPQRLNGFRVPVHGIQRQTQSAFESFEVPEEVIVGDLPPHDLPQGLDGIHVRRVLGQKKDRESFVPVEKGFDRPALVPDCVVGHDDQTTAGVSFEKKPEEFHEVKSIDRGGEVPVNFPTNGIHGSEDVRLLVISRPSHDLRLVSTDTPLSAQGGVELQRHFVRKDDIQAFEVPGATHKYLDDSFFLDRSRSSFPGRECLGLRSRHPRRWSWRLTCSSLKRTFQIFWIAIARRLQSQLLKGYPISRGPRLIHSTTLSHLLAERRDLRPGPRPTCKSPSIPSRLNRRTKDDTDWRQRPILRAASCTDTPEEIHCKAWRRSRNLRLDSILSLISSAFTGTRRVNSMEFGISGSSWEQLIMRGYIVKVH